MNGEVRKRCSRLCSQHAHRVAPMGRAAQQARRARAGDAHSYRRRLEGLRRSRTARDDKTVDLGQIGLFEPAGRVALLATARADRDEPARSGYVLGELCAASGRVVWSRHADPTCAISRDLASLRSHEVITRSREIASRAWAPPSDPTGSSGA